MRANLDISDVLVSLPARECPISSISFLAVPDPDWRLKEGLGLQGNWGTAVTGSGSYLFFLDISVQGGKVHEVIPM